MGDAFVRSQLAETGFFRTHQADTLTSVYPCTTTAATTSMLSGLSPAEHGWLGWSPWFREYGRIIDVFINRDSLSGQEILPAAGELMPFEDLTRQIYAATRGQVGLHQIQPNFAVDGVDTFDQMIERMRGYVALPGPQLILAYWHQPDSLMHMYGPGSQTVQKEVLAYEKQLEDLMNEISDTLLVVSADHGQVPVTRESIWTITPIFWTASSFLRLWRPGPYPFSRNSTGGMSSVSVSRQPSVTATGFWSVKKFWR
jgi:predicted AlkP superfamily pyrophosphatase or phosphodiesterase